MEENKNIEFFNLFVYDGDCAICLKTTSLLLRLNPQLKIGTSQEFSDVNFIGIQKKEFNMYAVFIDRDGRIHKGYLALLESLALKNTKYHLIHLFLSSRVVSALGKKIYKKFATNRHRFNCESSCKVRQHG